MESYLNIIHYCFYKLHYKIHLLFNKINPINIIHKLPFQKRKYEELAIDIQGEIDKAFGDTRFGLSVTVAGGMLLGVLAIFFFSILLIFQIHIAIYHLISCALLSFIISYYYVFKGDKYIIYLNKYENKPLPIRRKYCWITLTTLMLIFLLLFVGFIA